MKKKKLNLAKFEVRSFTTTVKKDESHTIKGGWVSITFSELSIHYCPSLRFCPNTEGVACTAVNCEEPLDCC
ncbi:MAG: pinensin family lanthipeptide [Cyclobacteriaceae bacterium]